MFEEVPFSFINTGVKGGVQINQCSAAKIQEVFSQLEVQLQQLQHSNRIYYDDVLI